MPDVVVTVPKNFGWRKWIEEGSAAGDPPTDTKYYFSVPSAPDIKPGERVYIVHNGKLRGYSPLVEIYRYNDRCFLVRQGGAVAVTIPQLIKGFQGYRYRWWDRSIEVLFPEWRKP